SRYGYEVKADMTAREQQRVIMAFQMHFRPAQWNGIADAETQAQAQHYTMSLPGTVCTGTMRHYC
ncbi:hypothetical protein MJL48_30630, partial [Salmonella enterica subsp. enterica serovar Kentucky]|nr:hypothetical protein [Salmonella enterica subsp. enterica serovar Kentucky]